jgi:hypothetical protein
VRSHFGHFVIAAGALGKMHSMLKHPGSEDLRCSFCNKSQNDVSQALCTKRPLPATARRQPGTAPLRILVRGCGLDQRAPVPNEGAGLFVVFVDEVAECGDHL